MSRPAAAAAIAAGAGDRNADGSVTLGPELFDHAAAVRVWRWLCRCGQEYQVRLDDLERAIARGPVALGVDLG